MPNATAPAIAGPMCDGLAYPMAKWTPIADPANASHAKKRTCHMLRDGRPHQTHRKVVSPVVHTPPPNLARSCAMRGTRVALRPDPRHVRRVDRRRGRREDHLARDVGIDDGRAAPRRPAGRLGGRNGNEPRDVRGARDHWRTLRRRMTAHRPRVLPTRATTNGGVRALLLVRGGTAVKATPPFGSEPIPDERPITAGILCKWQGASCLPKTACRRFEFLPGCTHVMSRDIVPACHRSVDRTT